MYIRNNQIKLVPDTLISLGMALQINRIAENQRFEIGVKESSRMTPFVALKVLAFPFINLVWLGVLFMITGFVMSMIRRIKLS